MSHRWKPQQIIARYTSLLKYLSSAKPEHPGMKARPPTSPRALGLNSSCHKLQGKCTCEPSRTSGTIIADRIPPDHPTPRLSTLQKLREPRAYFRNMRSKCRCSCVLQFTRHHRVSSVLHRPPSQMIHCIVLYLDSQT